MSKNLLEGHTGPVTQSADAVKVMLAYFGKEPAELPAFYRLSSDMVLVRSSARDVYYVVTPKACSCPSATYRPGSSCKHQRKFFPMSSTSKRAVAEASIRPDMRGFRPVSLVPGEVEA